MAEHDTAKVSMAKALLDSFLSSLCQTVGADVIDQLVQPLPDPNLPVGTRVPPPQELAQAIEADQELDQQIAHPGQIQNVASHPAPKELLSNPNLKAPEPPCNPNAGVTSGKTKMSQKCF
ncbi:hypothetical protein RSAG8_03777, partial [Rhizoctonia solani AG-8 WAC10335]